MRSGRGIAAAALGCVFLAHGPAWAQDAHLQGVFTGSVGYIDNVLSALEQNPTQIEADGFGTVTPGLVFSFATPRISQTLSYTFAASYFFRHAEANSYTNNASWTGRFVTSPTTTLSLGAAGSHGQLNTFQLTQPPTSALPQPVESGATTVFLQGRLNEGLSKQLSPTVSLGQAAGFTFYSPIEDHPARTYQATNTFSAQRSFRHDTAALALTFAYTHFDNIIDPVLENGQPVLENGHPLERFIDRDQLINTLVASWQHDFGHHFSSQLDAGLTQSVDLKGDHGLLWQPAALAALRYTHDLAQAELAYSHATALNVFLSQNMLVDQLTLRLAVPVSHAAHLDLQGSTGAQYSRTITNGNTSNPTTVLLTDAALLWSPITPIPEFGIALRYQHTTQLANEVGADPNDATRTVERDTQLVRNAVILSVSGAFPATTETGSRLMMTQPFGSSGAAPTDGRQTAPSESSESTEEQSSPPSGPAAQ